MAIKEPYPLYEVTLKIRSKSEGVVEILQEVLSNLGVSDKNLIECTDPKTHSISTYLSDKAKARVLERKLNQLKLKKVLIITKKLQEKDWLEKWKKDFQPFKLTDSFDVVPLWEKDKYMIKKRDPIYIDTTAAFGTGLHETTKFMVEFIEMSKGRLKTFFDLGTGTGILSIVAAKCGAKNIWAIDVNESTVDTAKKNLKNNACSFDNITIVDLQSLKNRKQFDFVAANLITHVLIKNKKKIVSYVRPQSYLAISGISLENLNLIKKEFKELPLHCLKIKKGKSWAALLYKRVQ